LPRAQKHRNQWQGLRGTTPKIPLSAMGLTEASALNNEFWDGFRDFRAFLGFTSYLYHT
jgi:hypothetical protein